MPCKPAPCFCGMDKRRAHLITMLLFKQPVRGEGSAHWPTASSICMTAGVFVCACVCFLTSCSTPPPLPWLTPNLIPPHPSISPPDRMTAHSALSKTQHTASAQPTEVAINPPAGLLAHWVATVRWLTLFIFFSMPLLLLHPPPQGPLLHPCLSELLKCIHQLSTRGKKYITHPGTLRGVRRWGESVLTDRQPIALIDRQRNYTTDFELKVVDHYSDKH